MKVKEKFPWRELLGFLLILILGMGIPFLMEYKSWKNPLSHRRPSVIQVPTLEDPSAHYCPACGSKVPLPEWQISPQQEDVKTLPLSLKTLTKPVSGISDMYPRGSQTRTAETEIRQQNP